MLGRAGGFPSSYGLIHAFLHHTAVTRRRARNSAKTPPVTGAPGLAL